ncbi:MAG: bifunctional DNA-formamidopyrimidine glycosylase/DNA-(apurinic or apyrimidinic site) lyase [Desulfovibrio sp.]|jgi:formamidopyrimidine-DNA glycosylase|nr:bifunctional DNA-formamidopyrimidine glycosylase/DNA-(apurinic or apyrimidinic site) lyase [Desulfovibrio sp.]
MPELPEVETIARTLALQIVGSAITSVHVLHSASLAAGAALLPALAGSRIARVARRGKLLVLCLEHDADAVPVLVPGLPKASLYLVFHLKMTGSFFVHPPETAALKHTRLIFDLGENSRPEKPTTRGRLFFDDIRTFGYCRVMLPNDFALWGFFTSLGPEPLSVGNEDIAQALKRGGGNIKAALLDQRRLAGIGNIYADESLFQAKIAPQTKISALSRNALLRLAVSLRAVLEQAVRECGSSIRNYRDAAGNAGSFQNSFMVYGRKGEKCRICGTTLLGSKVAGRTTVHCPRCQKLP